MCFKYYIILQCSHRWLEFEVNRCKDAYPPASRIFSSKRATKILCPSPTKYKKMPTELKARLGPKGLVKCTECGDPSFFMEPARPLAPRAEWRTGSNEIGHLYITGIIERIHTAKFHMRDNQMQLPKFQIILLSRLLTRHAVMLLNVPVKCQQALPNTYIQKRTHTWPPKDN